MVRASCFRSDGGTLAPGHTCCALVTATVARYASANTSKASPRSCGVSSAHIRFSNSRKFVSSSNIPPFKYSGAFGCVAEVIGFSSGRNYAEIHECHRIRIPSFCRAIFSSRVLIIRFAGVDGTAPNARELYSKALSKQMLWGFIAIGIPFILAAAGILLWLLNRPASDTDSRRSRPSHSRASHRAAAISVRGEPGALHGIARQMKVFLRHQPASRAWTFPLSLRQPTWIAHLAYGVSAQARRNPG